MRTKIRNFTLLSFLTLFSSFNGFSKTIITACGELNTSVFCVDLPNIGAYFGEVYASTLCEISSEIKIEYTDDYSNMNACRTNGYVSRNWIITDECGDTIYCTRRVNVAFPTIIECFPTTISCLDGLNAETGKGAIHITQSCLNAGQFIYSFEDDVSNVSDCGTGKIRRTWKISHPCGFETGCSQTIEIKRNKAPILNCSIVTDITIDCSGELSNLAIPTATDNCTSASEISITYEDDRSNLAPCGNQGFILRTWTATDVCGLTNTCLQTINIIDNTPPYISQCSFGNSLANCPDTGSIKTHLTKVNEEQITFLRNCVYDNCSNVTITSDFNSDVFSENCVSDSLITITYTFSDDCGNQTIATRTFTFINREEEDKLCDELTVMLDDNQLIISKLFAPRTIVKVYNQNWQPIFECNSNCDETVIITNLTTGEIYHTDIQFYDENWEFICADKQDVEIIGGGEPCDTSICQGDVILRTQAEVDAFCGCEVIEGDLILTGEGILNGVLGQASDINNVVNFNFLQEVNGNFVVANTNISDLTSFQNLKSIGGFLVVNYNSKLNRLAGLDFVENVGEGLVIEGNPLLENLDDLSGLKSYSSLSISGNLKNISRLKGIPINKLFNLSIINCELLESLDGLNNIDSIVKNENGVASFTIASNGKLKNIDALFNIGFVDADLNIVSNDKLTNCCSILHLIDANTDNGKITGAINIENNPQFCNSPQEILQNCQIPPSTCENIQIITQNNQITIEGLTAPNEIVKVFDKDYNILYECNANCEDSQLAGIFPYGNYIMDLQLYDENWQQICSEQRPVTLEAPTNISCETIQITSDASQIILSNIAAPNSIVKVFDPNWQIIYDCTATCENGIIVPVSGEGIYHMDIQFYDENWAFICANKQDVEVIGGGEPCDTFICQGDVVLQTQAEVDAFCECTVIEGNLTIGGPNLTESNVSDLSSLKKLKEIKGALGILSTKIPNLKGFEQLTTVGGVFYFFRNHQVKNFDGLEKLEKINGSLNIDANNSLENLNGFSKLDSLSGIFIIGNNKLQRLNGLQNLRTLGGLNISGGAMIENLDFLRQIENAIIAISITGSSKIENLEGLERFDTLGGLLLGGNAVLNDISALEDIQYIKGNLIIEQNKQLENCCIIKHLLSGGNRVRGRISYGYNKGGSSCDDPIQFERQCLEPPTACESIRFVTENDYLRISILTAPNEIIKVFDADYNIVYECFGECEGPIDVNDLIAGTYHISINFYDESWQPICERTESIEVVGNAQDRNRELLPTDFALFPNPAEAETYIDLSKLKGKKVQLALFNQFGQKVQQQVIENATAQKTKIDLTTFQNGLYILKIEPKGRRGIAKKLIVNRLY